MNKPGWQTTEFWSSIITAVLGILTTLGYLTSEQAGTVSSGIVQIVGGIITVGSIFGYAISRGLSKMAGKGEK